MKESMRSMDQDGTSRFSDARVGQQALMRFDRPEGVANDVYAHFAGRGPINRDEILDFLLTETPLYLDTEMLKSLERPRVDLSRRQ